MNSKSKFAKLNLSADADGSDFSRTEKLDQPGSWLILVSRVRLPDGANLMQMIRSELFNLIAVFGFFFIFFDARRHYVEGGHSGDLGHFNLFAFDGKPDDFVHFARVCQICAA